MKHFFLGGCLLILSTSLVHSEDSASMGYGEQQRNVPWDAYFATFGGYNWSNYEYNGYEEDFEDFSYGARASGSYDFQNGINLQKDFVFSRKEFGLDFNSGPFSGDVNTTDMDVATHIFYQNSEYLLGVIAQIGRTTFDFASFAVDTNRLYVGGEAQHYFGKFTLYGQVAYEKTKSDGVGFYGGGSLSSDGVIASLQGRYFFNENWRFDAKGTYTFQQFDADGLELDAWTLSAGTEYKFSDTPFSLTSDLSWTTADNLGTETQNTTFLVGVKMNLGAETLMERDRGGATLDPIEAYKPIEDLYIGSPT